MTEACQHLHDTLSALPRLRRDDMARVPDNGIYVLFEDGEKGHGGDRIVSVGTHKGQNKLVPRIREHFDAANKDRSIFRKHIGRCLLAKNDDPFSDQWEIDLTSAASRARNGHVVDPAKLEQVESEVTRYIAASFSFSVLRFDTVGQRLGCKKDLLSTVYQCARCRPSGSWLGRFHPSEKIRNGGLWNVQGLGDHALLLDEVKRLIELGCATSE